MFPSQLRATKNMDVCTCQDVFLFSNEESRLCLKHGLDNTYWKHVSFSKKILSLAVVSKSIPSKPVSAQSYDSVSVNFLQLTVP